MAGTIHSAPQPDDDWQTASREGDPPAWMDDAPPPWDWDEDPEPDYRGEYQERKKEAIQEFTDFGL